MVCQGIEVAPACPARSLSATCSQSQPRRMPVTLSSCPSLPRITILAALIVSTIYNSVYTQFLFSVQNWWPRALLRADMLAGRLRKQRLKREDSLPHAYLHHNTVLIVMAILMFVTISICMYVMRMS